MSIFFDDSVVDALNIKCSRFGDLPKASAKIYMPAPSMPSLTAAVNTLSPFSRLLAYA